ncbi:hypothetical protein K8U54_12985 [Pseudomonas fulva]|uniref:hypothetical protein n=1 Tax=Pseudomonas fulva TaxID=47880 RepID=UPI00201D35F9|nr:hypothetical protein [Pseudomonas fulva]UQY32659.1 hypothetical protein K8U54_12985 [Pseudomonas fulva]
MAYFTGSANDMAAVRSALVEACMANGWAWNSSTDTISKDGVFVRLQVVNGSLTLLGRTSALAGDAPNVVRVGAIGSQALTWPVEYHISVFDAEVYMFINYAVDRYGWCAFGQSTVDVPGTGAWVSASLGSGGGPVFMFPDGGGTGLACCCPAISWATDQQDTGSRNTWVHSDLDGQGWSPTQIIGQPPVGVAALAPLMSLLPNTWNSESVLLPIRAYKVRLEAKVSLTADLVNARCTRIDNYAPSEVINIGGERWKVFPWYRKDATARNGGAGVDHSGTFGCAIRYDGP